MKTYDERRADPQPCACGRLTTRPDLCMREQRCLMDLHPHSKVLSVLCFAPPDRLRRGQPDTEWGME